MKFLCDVTIGEGESVAPNTKFVKTWRIKNSGKKFKNLKNKKYKLKNTITNYRKSKMALWLSTKTG